jgi:ABC-type transport system involved in multi-copper enzyme maturation permease subunit
MNIITLILKDIKLFGKSKSSIALTFFVPMVITLIFGAIFGGFGGTSQLRDMKVLMVDQDNTDFSDQFRTVLDSLPELSVYTKQKVDDEYILFTEESMNDWIVKGRHKIGIVIPKGFQEAYKTGKTIPLKIHYDPKFIIEFNIIYGLLQKTIMQKFPDIMMNRFYQSSYEYLGEQTGSQFKTDIDSVVNQYFYRSEQPETQPSTGAEDSGFSPIGDPISLETVELLGQEQQNPAFAQYVAGMAVLFLLFSVTYAGASLLDEKHNGTIKRLLIAPVLRSEILISKMMYSIFLGIIQLSALFLFGWLVFKLPIFQHLTALIIMILATALACASIGIFIAAICKNQNQASGLSTLIVLGMSALGGSMVPSTMMPVYVNRIGQFTLNHWAMKGFTDIFWRNLGLGDILQSVFILIGIGIVFSAISIIIFNKKLMEEN